MLTLVLFTLIIGILFWTSRKPKYLPPGRWGLPVIGYCPFLTQEMTDIIGNLHKKYGDIFTWKLGGRVLVFLNEYNLIKTTFSKPECQGRPNFYTLEIAYGHTNSGLFNAMGHVWKEGRRFALQHLKDFGMGKSSMEDVILYEAGTLVKSYESKTGTPVEVSWNVNVAVLNVIWKLVADRRYEIDDEEIIAFSKMLLEQLDAMQGSAALLDYFPGLHQYLPKFILGWMKVDILYDQTDQFNKFVMKIINEHKDSLDVNKPRDYIDAFLIEVEKQKGNPDTVFKDDYRNLMSSIGDFFDAGSETTSNTLQWMVLLLALNPDVQKKMQKEIDQEVPRDRTPSLQDKHNLPYTEAVLLEVQRYSSILPVGFFHTTTEDVKVDRYVLPKGTLLLANAAVCHRDPKHWKRPDEFYPENFLDDEGHVLAKKEGFLPFSLGRRQCLGESLAKMELFLFGTCLFQNFFIASPEGVTLSTEIDKSSPLFNIVKPYKVVMTKRQ